MRKVFILVWLLVSIVGYANNDKYRLILTTDPATTMTIGWNQSSGSNPVVYYGTTDFGTNHLSYPNSKTVDRSVTSRGMANRFARLTGLTPDTNYYFVINDSQGNSQRFWFRTAPDDLSRLSFIAGGDSRNNPSIRRNANRLVAKLKPHAVLFGGDMTDGDSSGEWQDWLDDWQSTIASDGRMFPIVPTVGNHEGSTVIYELFDTPTSDSYFAITFGDDMVRAYTLNTNISVSGNQLTWLDNDLSNNLDAVWRTVQYHKPMRPHTTSKSEGEAHYQAWAELFYNKGVRLVVDCDSHLVKTTWPLQPSSGAGNDEGFIRNDTNGTVYAGEGCWGAPTRTNDDDKSWTRDSGSFNQFKLIFVEETKIELRTILFDNESSVGEVSNTDPFTLPANLNVWNPSNGDVVIINHSDIPTPPSIAFADGEFNDYSNGTGLSLDVDVIDAGGGITKVDFYIDGVFQSSDTTSPYSYTDNYASGSYTVEAIATNVNGQTDTATININVGSFTENGIVFIADGNDDVEEDESDGTVYFDSSDLEFFDDGGWQVVGLRFQNLGIPNGATITTADIRFKSDASDAQNPMNMLISIEDSGDAAPFESNAEANVSARDLVSTSVTWTVDDWSNGERGADTTTDDLKDLLQEVVNRCDWTPGNSMVFVFERTGANANNASVERRADTYEENPPDAAQIRFTYTYNAGVANPDVTKFVANAWTNGAPTTDSTVIILDDYDTATYGSFDACYLEVNPGKTLTVGAGDYVSVNGGMTVNGTLTIEHEGSFLQTDSNAIVENNGRINVEITTPMLAPRDFMIMGSPMSDETRDDVFEDAFLVLDHTTANFFPHPDVTALFPGAENFADDKTQNGKFWNQYTGSIDAGRGYLVRPQLNYGDGNKTYNMTYDKGTLNNGDVSFNVAYNTSKNDSPNVLANPYASAIFADDFINAHGMVSEVFFWEHLTPPSASLPGSQSMNFSMEDISMYNLMGGNPAASEFPGTSTTPNGYISTGQGFGIKATSSGTVTFTNTMRRSNNNNTLRGMDPDGRNRIWVAISNETYEMQNTTLIGFTSEATAGIDNGYDSRRLATVLSLYSHLDDGSEELGIQSREAFESGMKVLLGFSTLIDAPLDYQIDIKNIHGENLEGVTVYLIDNYLDIVTNLSDEPYTFRSTKGTFDNRFTLQFEEEAILNTSDFGIDQIVVYPNPAIDVLNILAPKVEVQNVIVYDIQGKVVATKKFGSETNYSIDLSSLKTAMYFAKIQTAEGTITKRIIKK